MALHLGLATSTASERGSSGTGGTRETHPWKRHRETETSGDLVET